MFDSHVMRRQVLVQWHIAHQMFSLSLFSEQAFELPLFIKAFHVANQYDESSAMTYIAQSHALRTMKIENLAPCMCMFSSPWFRSLPKRSLMIRTRNAVSSSRSSCYLVYHVCVFCAFVAWELLWHVLSIGILFLFVFCAGHGWAAPGECGPEAACCGAGELFSMQGFLGWRTCMFSWLKVSTPNFVY